MSERNGAQCAVYVIGSGSGESVVIELLHPDGGSTWGVVDCCAASISNQECNWTLRFLRDKRVSRLAFCCLTHPHEDHVRGMHHLLEHAGIEVDNVYLYAAADAFLLNDLFRGEESRLSAAARAVGGGGWDGGRLDADLSRHMVLLHGAIERREKERRGRSEAVAPGTVLWSAREKWGIDIPLSIRVVGPVLAASKLYWSRVQATMDGERVSLATARNYLNLLSMVIVVDAYGCHGLLAGDAEDAAWGCMLSRADSGIPECGLVKVAHHGSPQALGREAGLWALITNGGRRKPIAAIAARRAAKLPRPESVEYLRECCSRVVVLGLEGGATGGSGSAGPEGCSARSSGVKIGDDGTLVTQEMVDVSQCDRTDREVIAALGSVDYYEEYDGRRGVMRCCIGETGSWDCTTEGLAVVHGPGVGLEEE